MTTDHVLAEIQRNQHGLVERSQAVAEGVTHEMIRSRLLDGSMERVFPRVYKSAGSPETWEQRLLGACLSSGPGAVASHRSAAQLWGLRLPFRDELEITIPRRKAPRLTSVTIHCSGDLDEDDIVVRHGIPATKPARTLVDLGAVCPRWIVDGAIDSALATKLVTLEGLWWMLARVSRKGRSGAGVLRRCLEWRFGVPDSVLEGLFLQIVRDYGLPEPVVQYPITVNGRSYRVDAAYPDCMLALELDGAERRMSPQALHEDLTRQNDLIEAGMTPLRFTWVHLTQQQPAVAGKVHGMLERLPAFSRQKVG